MVYSLKIMGVLNCTPDSFSDGGKFYDPKRAVEHALRMEAEGADIIDIGGESTRPFAEPVSLEEEAKRVLPVIEGIRNRSNIPISVDTTKSKLALRAVEAGATMINDVSAGCFDPEMFFVTARVGTPICLMHMKGEPKTMQQKPSYEDVVGEVKTFLKGRIAACMKAGVPKENIIIDPGIGFGKRLEDNLNLLKYLDMFKDLGCEILIGTSRKSFLGHLTGADVKERLPGSLASLGIAIQKGASILRVHDVAQTKQFLTVFSRLV